jgi:hypothetical protein
MKKLLSTILLVATIVACGGGGGSAPDKAPQNSGPMYGFDAKGSAYVASMDLQKSTYKYSQVNTLTGELSGDVSAALTPSATSPGIYSIYGHRQHTLAVDASQTTVLASTQSGQDALPEPAMFTTKPLTSLADIAGSYYLGEGPFWYKLNISPSGSASIDCKDFTLVESVEDMVYRYNACENFVSSNVRLELQSAPYWKITSSIATKDGANGTISFEITSSILFATSASGRVAYLGAGSSTVCFSGNCSSNTNSSVLAWQESQNYASPATWPGTWAFNRQGGSGTVLAVGATGTGTTSSGRNVTSTIPVTTNNLDSSLLGRDLVSYSTRTEVMSSPTETKTITVTEVLGYATLRRRGGNLAVQQSFDSVNNNALFDKIPLKIKTVNLAGSGVSGPYDFPEELFDSVDVMDVSIEAYNASSSEVYTTIPLKRQVDYSTYSSSAATISIDLRTPLPSFDDQRHPLRLVVKYGLVPVGMTTSPTSWGIRFK